MNVFLSVFSYKSQMSLIVFFNRNALELSTMVGENFEMYWTKVVRNALQLSTMVGNFLEMYWTKVARNALQLSTMVGIFFRNVLD